MVNNEKFKLYPVSSLQQDPSHDLSGTWVIINSDTSRILSDKSSMTGRLGVVWYNPAADNTDIIIPSDNVQMWTFTNVVRDWYTISAEGGYLNIIQGSVSVSNTPQNLLIRSDDNFASILITNGQFDANGNSYCLRMKKDDDTFESASLAVSPNTETFKKMTLLKEAQVAKSSGTITGNWAIITENSGAALLDNANNNKLGSVPYLSTEYGVYSFETEIPAWTFTQIDGGWYTIQTQDGKYLTINKKDLTLSNNEAKVFIQEYNGKIRITDGKQYALNNWQGNPTTGYSIHDKGKAADINEWQTLSRLDRDASLIRTIVFDSNGGTTNSVPEAVTGKTGEKIILPNMEATKDGHAFMGWAEVENFFAINPKTKQTYNDLYKPGETYTYNFNASEKTLYAVYNTEANQKIQFGIRLDGVIQDEPNDYDKGAYKGHFTIDGILKESRWAIDIDSTKPVNGYYINNDVVSCLNWVPSAEQIAEALKKDGNVSFDPETQYIHYYVLKKTPGGQWHVDGVIRNREMVEVTYNVNVPGAEKTLITNMPGAYQTMPGTDIMIGTDKGSTEIKRPGRKGYFFIGWNTKEDGTGAYYSESSIIHLTQNLNLYAQWISEKDEPLEIRIASDWPEGKVGYIGARITLTAKLIGFENKMYNLQWQYTTDNENWTDVPGANDITYTYTLDETTTNYTWRIIALDIR